MPRASWKGFLRLSLVSCPIYLSPATTRTKSIRLHQVWQPKAGHSGPVDDEEEDEQPAPARRSFAEDFRGEARPEPPSPARVALRPHDPHTGEEIEREEVVKGYEYERGQFVTFTPEELKALDVESSKIIDLETFVPRAEVDPIYFSTPYYLYPDGARITAVSPRPSADMMVSSLSIWAMACSPISAIRRPTKTMPSERCGPV